MERTVSASEAGPELGRLLDDVMRGDRVVVEREGEPVAAVIPIEEYWRWRRDAMDLFDHAREVSQRAGLSEDEAMTLALEAQAWARGKRNR
jgi:prevent-host-death family protein